MLNKTFNITEIKKKDYKYSRIIQNILENNGWKYINGNATYSNKNNLSIIKTYLDGTDNIFLKHKLAENFKDFYFIPETYVIHNIEKDILPQPSENSLWFLKPSSMLIGSGDDIHIIRFKQNDDVRNIIKKLIKSNQIYILQKNVENPLLIYKKKFDLRIHGVIVYTHDEFAAYIYDKGIIRMAISEFNLSTNPENMMTNISLYKLTDNIFTLIYDNDKTYYTYFDYIVNIFSCVIKCLFNKLINKGGVGFIFVGLDVLIDENGKIYILEINQHPTLYDDSSSLEAAYNYKYYHNSNKDLFKDFYTLIFDSIIKNKLINNNVGGWKISNFYKFKDKIKCMDKIVYTHNDLSLYKFNLTTKEVNFFYIFLKQQPFPHINTWNSQEITEETVSHMISNNYRNSKLYLGLVKDKKIIGILGISKRNANKYFTSIIIDKAHSQKGIGYIGMKILLEYIKTKYNIKIIYASIYEDNIPSIKLHTKLGYDNLGIYGNRKGRNVIIMKYTL